MNIHPYKYTDQVLSYVKENAGKIDAKDIASYIGVSVMALRRQCVVWRQNGSDIPSLKKKDQTGAIKIFNYRRGRQEKHIKSESGKWVSLSIYNYKKHHGEIPYGHKLKFKDGDSMNCEHDNLCVVPVGYYYKEMAHKKHAHTDKDKNIDNNKNTHMAQSAKPPTKGTTSQKKKPGTDANWTQKHLMESKEMKIPDVPKGNGIRIDSRTIVFPKKADVSVDELKEKYIKNYSTIKEEIKSYASNDF